MENLTSQGTLADAAEEAIQAYIADNRLTPGAPLPKEQELADQLGISRNVVREALSRLRMLGLIESRKRRGMIVAKPDLFSGLLRLVEGGCLDEDSRLDLFELRIMIEIGMADFAFHRKTERDLEFLSEIVEREESDPGNDVLATECAIAFHGHLYAMTGNAALSRIQELLISFFRISDDRKRQSKLTPSRLAPTHRQVLKALRSGTAEEFRTIIYRQMQGYLPALFKEERRGEGS
ncbi:MAG: FadR/GntR family transcriptional regulator [Planctomycetota bacterium]|jgi:DNA-binding FadR family transcriptional regulator